MITKHLTKKQNALLLLVIFCIFLELLRVQLTQSLKFSFLLWNLFLAFIPYVISEFIKISKLVRQSKFKMILVLICWVLFLPNAPYIITDFIHFRTNNSMVWYDLFLLFCFANTGLILAIISIKDIHSVIIKIWNVRIGNIFTTSMFFLCGFGIYLGRFLRFNSWDIISSPMSLLNKSILSFMKIEAWYVTLGFGVFLWILFSLYSTNVSTEVKNNSN